MAKKEKKNLIIAIVGTIILLLILAYISGLFNFNGGNGGGGGIITKKVSVTCDVTLKNSPIEPPKIETPYCTYKEVISCGFVMQGIFEDTGNVRFTSAGNSVTKDFTIKELEKQYFTIRLCGMPLGTTTGNFQVFTNGKIVQEVPVNFLPA